jgi:hypothetical protein
MIMRSLSFALVFAVLVLSAVAHADPGPAVLAAHEHDGMLDLPDAWLAEDTALAADLPRRAELFEERWSSDRHSYRVSFIHGDDQTVKDAFGKRNAHQDGVVLSVGNERRHITAAFRARDVGVTASYQVDKVDLAALMRSLPPLAGVLPILDSLGAPERVTAGVSAGDPLDARVEYRVGNMDLAALGKKLSGAGWKGDQKKGWDLISKTGPSVTVSLRGQVLTVEAIGAK